MHGVTILHGAPKWVSMYGVGISISNLFPSKTRRQHNIDS